MIKFGTSGYRSAIGDGFTKENIQKIAQALATIIKKEKSTTPVVVGFDRRFLSDTASVWVTEVMAGNDIKTKLYTKAVASPTVMYTVMADKLDYGVIITASHNPYNDNGIKIVTKGGRDSSLECVAQIEKYANSHQKIKSISIEDATKQGLVELFDNEKEYVKNITKFVSKEIKENKLKVVFDSMHGVTVEPIQQLAKAFKLNKFTLLNDSVDPYFNHKLPAPNESLLSDLKQTVVKDRYSIGLASDGDGDRLGVFDEKGTFYDNNVIMAVIYYYLVKYRGMKGDIVKNRQSSILLDQLAEKLGYKCHEVHVGFKYVSAKMDEVNALLGGECSGGLTVRGYIPSKDGLFSSSMLIDAIATIKKPLSKIVAEVKTFAGYISTYVDGTAKIKNKKAMQKTLQKIIPNFSYKPVNITYDDGTKYVFEDGSWILLRFSGTENLLRYTLEFPTEIECERNQKAINEFLKKYDN